MFINVVKVSSIFKGKKKLEGREKDSNPESSIHSPSPTPLRHTLRGQTDEQMFNQK